LSMATSKACSDRSSASAAWKSAGSAELNCSRSPVAGWSKPSVCACSAGRPSASSARSTASCLQPAKMGQSGASLTPGTLLVANNRSARSVDRARLIELPCMPMGAVMGHRRSRPKHNMRQSPPHAEGSKQLCQTEFGGNRRPSAPAGGEGPVRTPVRLAARDGGDRAAGGAAVRRVAQQRVAQVARVHADLVRAPRAQAPAHQRRAAGRQRLQHLVAAAGVAAPARCAWGESSIAFSTARQEVEESVLCTVCRPFCSDPGAALEEPRCRTGSPVHTESVGATGTCSASRVLALLAI